MNTSALAMPVVSRTRSATMSGFAPRVATLVLQAPHEHGIVSSVNAALANRRVTVLDSAHYADAETGTFFQRVQIDLSTISDRAGLEGALEGLVARTSLKWRLWYGDRKRRIAIFTSRHEHCLYDLLVRHRAGELPCEIAMIVSNHHDAHPIARHFAIPFHPLPVTPEVRAAQEEQAADLVEAAGVDLIVLARYMQILSPAFVTRFPEMIINVHHSFLPAFEGARPHAQAHVKGVKMIGATSHYVTADLDQGPIIEQATVRCSHRDTVADLQRKGRELEKSVLAAAVRWHLEDRLVVAGTKTIVFD